jgi:antitoxin PrlF
MWSAKVTSKGQITLPKGLRDALGLHAGSHVTFEMSGDSASLKAATSAIDRFYGILHRQGRKALSVEEMDEGSRSKVRERARRR